MSSTGGPARSGATGDTQAAIRAVWERRREEVIRRVDTVDEAVAALLSGSLDGHTRSAAHRAAHQLAGAAGTFGFPRGSQLAHALEHALDPQAALSADWAPRLSELALALRAELEGDPSSDARTAADAAQGGVTLLVVSADAELADGVEAEAAGRGMRVLSAQGSTAARRLTDGERFDIVLLDLDLPGEEQAALELLSDLAGGADPVPVACITGAERFADRIEVARRGSRGHLPRTLPAGSLLEAVEALLDTGRERPREVLVVDDDAVMLEGLASLLAVRGLHVHSLADPLSFWDALETSCPDLVLLDVDMPEVDGIDLCRVVRNDPRWMRLPVLFLTGRTDAATVQRVFEAGADDYVSKPIIPVELTTRVANRLERVALLRSLADTDPLTGVSTRRASTEHLERNLRLAERHERPLALAVLDLDDFKAVNDRHGHAVGDQVLQRLGALLRTRFRGEDVAARWGGEEFVVGLYPAGATDTVQRLCRVLEAFRGEPFKGRDGQTFHVSFSAGVAAAPHHGQDLESLYKTADRALYRAKQAGRDRVLAATSDPGVAREENEG